MYANTIAYCTTCGKVKPFAKYITLRKVKMCIFTQEYTILYQNRYILSRNFAKFVLLHKVLKGYLAKMTLRYINSSIFTVKNIVIRGIKAMARRGENIYKRKDGRWEGRYKSGFKPDGSIKYASVYAKSYAEVKALLSEKRIITAENPASCDLTVNNLFEQWFDNIRLKVKESTYANYYMKYEKHILPALGGLLYEKLTAEKLNDFIITKIKSGLSSKYAADIAGVIKSVCRFAHMRYGYADKSENMTIPKGRVQEKVMLDKSEQAILIDYLTKNPTSSNMGILLSLSTGLRVGELCALMWSDIDLKKRIITVRHTMQRIHNIDGGTKLVITSPKSDSSVRDIPLPEFMVPLLKNIRSADNTFLLSGTNKIVEPRTMQYRLKSILKRLKLSDVSFHSLRHLFATNCIAVGFDVKTLSEILGHSSVEITLNRYVHSSMERKTECMKLLAKSFLAV